MKTGWVDPLARHLARLSSGSPLPVSSVSKADLRKLQSLFDAGVMEEVRSGPGRSLVVTNPMALQAFILSLYPSGLEGFNGDLPSRSRAVAERRDSKKTSAKRTSIVLVRGFNGCAFQKGESRLEVAKWTEFAGVAALCPDFVAGWSFSGKLGLVENLETFWHIEMIAPFVDLAIYNAGRIAADLLEWINSPGMMESRVVHFPDYDPVGMDEYLRIKRACPQRSELFWPPDLEELFGRFGKAQLLHDSSAILARLRKNDDPDVHAVVQLMDRFGAGLEQEALLIGRCTNS